MIPTIEQFTPVQISEFPKMVCKPIININDGGMRRLSTNFIPGPNDVLCSRGNAVKKHPGNIRFLQIAQTHIQQYAKAGSKLEKSMLVSEIIDTVRESSPEGGFVKLIDGCWWEVGDNQAREKTGQALRNNISSKYSSSSQAKKRRRRANEANLASKVEEIVAKTNGTNLADRIQELTTSEGNTNKSDEEIKLIFNQANCELLNRINEFESSQNQNSEDSSLSSFSESESSFIELFF